MDQPLSVIAIVVATFFVAGVVKGVTGMGLPTVAMGVLGALLSPVSAAALLLIPSFITNVWQLASGPALKPLVIRLWPMMTTIIIGAVAGSAVIARGDARHTTLALGVALIVYAAYTLLARPLRVAAGTERYLSPLIGAVTGVATGATGVFVIPAVPYIQALDLERDELVQALGLSFTVSTVALAVGLAWHGALPAADLAMSGLALVPALIGMSVGQVIRQRISPTVFRRGFLVCLFLLGVQMLIG